MRFLQERMAIKVMLDELKELNTNRLNYALHPQMIDKLGRGPDSRKANPTLAVVIEHEQATAATSGADILNYPGRLIFTGEEETRDIDPNKPTENAEYRWDMIDMVFRLKRSSKVEEDNITGTIQFGIPFPPTREISEDKDVDVWTLEIPFRRQEQRATMD